VKNVKDDELWLRTGPNPPVDGTNKRIDDDDDWVYL